MGGIKAVVFDLDGTLIDSAPDIHAAANVALAALGRAPLDLARIISFIGNGMDVLVTRCLEATGGSTPQLHADAMAVFLRAYGADNTTLTRYYSGAEACLQQLRAQGMKLALCTNKQHDATLEICDALGLGGYFDAIHGARAEVPKKPDAAALLNCLSDLGVAAEEAIYVGDSTVDHRTAANAGIRFAFFTGGYLNGTLDTPEPVVRFDDWSQDWLSAAASAPWPASPAPA